MSKILLFLPFILPKSVLTILGRLDRRPPLKLGKSVLTLTESTKKYPLTAENLRPRGRLRGGRQISDRRPRGVNYATYGTTLEVFLTYILWISPIFLTYLLHFTMQKDADGFGVEIPSYN